MPKSDGFDKILIKYLKIEKKPTKAVNKALDEFNNSREEKDGISTSTAWRKYKKIKKR